MGLIAPPTRYRRNTEACPEVSMSRGQRPSALILSPTSRTAYQQTELRHHRPLPSGRELQYWTTALSPIAQVAP